MSEPESAVGVDAPEQSRPGARLARNLVFYTVLRLLLVVLLMAVVVGLGLLFGVKVPILVAGVIAVLVALPLSMWLFTRTRAEINADIAAFDASRRAKREDLRRRMSSGD